MSVRLDAGVPNDLCPSDAFCPELGSSLVWRITDRLEAKRRHSLFHVRQSNDLDDLTMEQRRNFFWCPGRKNESEPAFALYVGEAGFHHGGHVGQRPGPCLARHRQSTQLAIVDLRHRRWQRAKGYGCVPTNRRDDSLAGTVERYMHEIETERQAELLADEMGRRTGSRGGKAVCRGIGFDQRNEVLHRPDRQRWMNRQDYRRGDSNRYGVEVLVGVVGYGVVHGRIDDDIWRNDEQGVAVGCRFCSLTHADAAAGATYVFDVILLSETLRQFLSDEAGQYVSRTAGGVRNYHPHRPRPPR